MSNRNVYAYAIGTVGPSVLYQLYSSFLLTFILFTRTITVAQFSFITIIMAVARVIDALNDPLMGHIIERTRSKWGKFKPWLAAGAVGNVIVAYYMFGNRLEGWPFIIFFGLMYLLYDVTFTAFDIAYWGMIPALGSHPKDRNRLSSLSGTAGSIGNGIALFAIPLLTTGEKALGGNAAEAYRNIALLIGVFAILTVCVTLIGVRENKQYNQEPAPAISFKKIFGIILRNDQLRWAVLTYLFVEIGRNIVLGGIGTMYIYFEFGYNGALYSTFTMVAMIASIAVMPAYGAIANRINRKSMMRAMVILLTAGYAIMLTAGILMPATTAKFVLLTVGFMLARVGMSVIFLIMMVSVLNTVEYNEYKYGERNEAIIASLRPFITKFASALVVIITSLIYIIFDVTKFTNQISDLEQQASLGLISDAQRISEISTVLLNVSNSQTTGLILCATVLPILVFAVGYSIYKKKYTLDEEEYDRICSEINLRKSN